MSVFSTSGLDRVVKIEWNQLRPGMVLLGGIQVNNIVPEEFRGYPVLTEEMIDTLSTKYQFLGEREIIVALAQPGFNGRALSMQIRRDKEKMDRTNVLRKNFFSLKKKILDTIKGDTFFEQDYLIRDQYNSFTVDLSENQFVPSFFHNPEIALTMGNILSKDLREKWIFPDDLDVNLHIVVDFSNSMRSAGKLDLAIESINFFYQNFLSLLDNTKLDLYAFSDVCRHISYPLSGGEIAMKETNYGTFIKKVLHHRDSSKYNKVILFTDGKPSDPDDAHKYGRLFKKNGLDFSQVIFAPEREEILVVENGLPLSADNVIDLDAHGVNQSDYRRPRLQEVDKIVEDTFKSFTEFAVTAGGNQIILKFNELIQTVSVECYDRYLGLLTLQQNQK